MSISTDEIQALLEMAASTYRVPEEQRIRSFWVDYWAITPKGTKGRLQRTTSLNNINGARSETAVYFYLKEKHPGCDILIKRLEFR
jgi:hypothetical protein